jgi:hypothetical protein
MSERKKPTGTKIEPKKRELVTIEPKKREVPIELPVIEPNVEVKETKPKKIDKYIRLALDANMEERKQFTGRVEKGEISLSYYAIDNDKGYHYYIINKN